MGRPNRTYQELAPLYDIAFSWDVSEEVDWLIERLGPSARTVLEPAAGSGRMFPAFARKGVEVIGVEISEAMIRRAQKRMAALGFDPPRILRADMASFELDAPVDGAICPINSFGYLQTFDQALSHLQCVARSLHPGARYLAQVDLIPSDQEGFSWSSLDEAPPDEAGVWEDEVDGIRVRTTWGSISYDVATKIQTEVGRFDILSGAQAGSRVEDHHPMRKWCWAEWCRLLERSPFRQTAAYDGNRDRSRLPLNATLERERLTWHELILGERLE